MTIGDDGMRFVFLSSLWYATLLGTVNKNENISSFDTLVENHICTHYSFRRMHLCQAWSHDATF